MLEREREIRVNQQIRVPPAMPGEVTVCERQSAHGRQQSLPGTNTRLTLGSATTAAADDNGGHAGPQRPTSPLRSASSIPEPA